MTNVRAFEGGERYRLPGLAGVCAALLPPEDGGPNPWELAADVERFAARLPARARIPLRLGVASVAALGDRTPGQAADAVKTVVLLVAGGRRNHARELRHLLPASPRRADAMARRPRPHARRSRRTGAVRGGRVDDDQRRAGVARRHGPQRSARAGGRAEARMARGAAPPQRRRVQWMLPERDRVSAQREERRVAER